MGMYDYKGKGTYLNGFLNYIHKNHPEIEIQIFNQAQQFNSSTSTAFLPMLCYMLCF